MKSCRLLIALLMGGVVGGGSSLSAAEIQLPPVTGKLSGEFKALKVPGAPVLRWNADIRAATVGSEAREMELGIDGDGLRLRVLVMLASAKEGTWKVTEGELDLGAWFPNIAKLSADLGGLTVKGTMKVSGTGVIATAMPSGTLRATMLDGRIEQPTEGWVLDGVTFTADLGVDADGFRTKSLTPFEAKVGTVTSPRFGARNVLLRGMLKEDRTIALSEARVEIAGGEITVEPTTVALSPFAIEATLHVVNVGLQDLVALVPESLSAAQGRIDGTVTVGWSTKDGFRVGAGNLSLGQTEPATVRLAAAPGLLTRSMPKRFELVAGSTNPLFRWLSADNPVHADMTEIEMGRADLQVDSLAIRLTPEGDVNGRTATVQMKARPVKAGGSVKSVDINVNVAGPLDAILKLGLNQDFSGFSVDVKK